MPQPDPVEVKQLTDAKIVTMLDSEGRDYDLVNALGEALPSEFQAFAPPSEPEGSPPDILVVDPWFWSADAIAFVFKLSRQFPNALLIIVGEACEGYVIDALHHNGMHGFVSRSFSAQRLCDLIVDSMVGGWKPKSA